MALTFTDMARTIAVTTAGTSYTNAGGNFTPVANRLYLVGAVWSPQTASGGQISGITSTTGLTFAEVDTGAGNRGFESAAFACGLYRAMKPSGLSAGTYTVQMASGNRTGCCAFLIEVDGVVTTGTDGADAIGNVAVTNASGTTPTVALSFASASNGTFAMGAASNRTAPSASNLTQIGSDPDINSPDQQVFGGYDVGNQTAPEFTITSDFWAIVAAEIIAATGGGGARASLVGGKLVGGGLTLGGLVR